MKFPIVSIHIPKCGGTSLLSSLLKLEPEYRLIEFYPDNSKHLPENFNFDKAVIHGHFERFAGRAIENVLPDAQEFITLLRSPYDVCTSAYRYGLENNFDWATNMNYEKYMDWWFEQPQGPLLAALPNWQHNESVEQYASKFLEIGVLDHLDKYLDKLSNLFGVNIGAPQKINITSNKRKLPDLSKTLERAHPRDYELYDYVKNTYTSNK